MKKQMKQILTTVQLAFALVASAPAFGGSAFTIDNVFGDHMVLQRNKPIRVTGSADPARKVTVRLGDDLGSAYAQADGRWCVELPARPAGGPYELKVELAGAWANTTFEDVMIGDVWICSGQSNMDMPVWGGRADYRLRDGDQVAAAANDGKLRLMEIPQVQHPDGPQTDAPGRPRWRPAVTAAAVVDFSAVGYLFGRELRRALADDVAIGLVDASWGGTRIEAWIPRASFEASDAFRKRLVETDAVCPPQFDPIANLKALNSSAEEIAAARVAWWARFDSQGAKDLAPFAAPAADESAWTKAPPAELKGLLKRGIAWNRFHFNVPESWANEELNLLIDALKGSDEAYLDGVKIGGKTNVGETSPRAYACRVAKGGKHVVALRMKCVLPPGGMGAGIFLENARTRELIGVEETREWLEKVEFVSDDALTGAWPADPKSDEHRNFANLPTTLYNAMLAPVTTLNVKGVIWYQGCSNYKDFETYADFGRMLVESWRTAFRDPQLPFLVTQLSAYVLDATEAEKRDPEFWKKRTPTDLGFAPLRAQQERMAALPNTALACTIDAGEAFDIHPKDKLTVARRLAHEARRLAYGEPLRTGPRAAKVTREGAALVVSFADVGEGLYAKGGAIGGNLFSVAGADGVFHVAEAELRADNTVRVAAADVPAPERVRYCHTAWPVGGFLYRKGDDLPVFPFDK